MSVRVTFHCSGCDAVAPGTDSLRVEFRSFSGRSYGVGTAVPQNTVEDVTPAGWIAYDPYTYVTYCPTCWKTILDAIDDVVIAASDPAPDGPEETPTDNGPQEAAHRMEQARRLK